MEKLKIQYEATIAEKERRHQVKELIQDWY